MQDNFHHKVSADNLYNAFELEDILVKLNRLSHFLEHDKFNRHDIFKKCIAINFHSYFIDNKYVVDGLLKRLKKKVSLLDDIEHKIDDTETQLYIKKIWEDIFLILDLFDEQISKSIKRFENGINADFKVDVDDYKKTEIIREIEKEDRSDFNRHTKRNENNNSWLMDDDLSHGMT